MEKAKINVGNEIVYNVVSSSKDKITLERTNEESKIKYILEIENSKGVGKGIIQVLSNQYIKRLSNATQLHK